MEYIIKHAAHNILKHGVPECVPARSPRGIAVWLSETQHNDRHGGAASTIPALPQQQQLDSSASPYIYSGSPRPVQHVAPPPFRGAEDSVVSTGPHAGHRGDGIGLNKHDDEEGEWSSNLKESKVARVTTAELPPTVVGAFFALALLGDIACTALAWVEVYSSGTKQHLLPNVNLYYLVDKPPTSHWSTAGYVCGVLFVAGVWALRFKTQQYYRVPRRFWFALYATLFCTCCSMAQMSKHVDQKNRQQQQEQSSGQGDVLPAFP